MHIQWHNYQGFLYWEDGRSPPFPLYKVISFTRLKKNLKSRTQALKFEMI